MNKSHHYHTSITWTGNRGEGTSSYRNYYRDYIISIENKPDISGSSDPLFRGDATRHNPEELLLASLSACHMLWYLHLCADAGIIVSNYVDHASGEMILNADGSGRFKEVILSPEVVILNPSDIDQAIELHHKANAMCFIASSVNFPVIHQPKITTK